MSIYFEERISNFQKAKKETEILYYPTVQSCKNQKRTLVFDWNDWNRQRLEAGSYFIMAYHYSLALEYKLINWCLDYLHIP